jgi:hypothetical protein
MWQLDCLYPKIAFPALLAWRKSPKVYVLKTESFRRRHGSMSLLDNSFFIRFCYESAAYEPKANIAW